MRRRHTFLVLFALVLWAATGLAQDKTTGGVKGRVRVESGSPAGVLVTLQDAGRSVGQVETGRNGAFEFRSVKPGSYTLSFKKPGLRLGTLDSVEVKPGKTNELEDRLVMSVDEGSLAFIRGSVFSTEGYSIEGAKVEIAKISGDGSLKKLDSRLTGETGEFVFRVSPAVSKYRLTAKINGAEPVSKDVEVDGAAVYRVALNVSKQK